MKLEEKDFYTVEEIAKLLSYSARTVRDMLKHGEIKGEKFRGKGQWRVSSTEVHRILGEQKAIEDLPKIAEQLKAQLFVPAPETVPEALLIHDFGGLGPYSFSFREDDFKAIWRNLGYNTSEFKVYKESSGILSGDAKIDVVISDYGNLELYCLVEENPLFKKLLASLPGGKEQFDELKQDVGKYLTRCRRIYAEIHREATEHTWQSTYEGVARYQSKLQNWPPPLTRSFANLVYWLSILYHRTSSDYGLPDKSLYQIRPLTGYFPPFSGLYLGEINLGNSPDPPFIPPPPLFIFTKLPHMLEDLKDRHRNMILKWSASPAIRELLELFNSCLKSVEALKLDDSIRGK